MDTRVRARVAGGALVASVMLVGCAEPSGETESACALALQHEGRTYVAIEPDEPVAGVDPVAEVRFAPCDDSGGQDEPGPAEAADAAARFAAMTITGIDPTVAFVVPTEWPEYVFYSGSSDPGSLPPEVERLLGR
jgi:hypothetical protein